MRTHVRELVQPLARCVRTEAGISLIKMKLAAEGRLAFLVTEDGRGGRSADIFFPRTTAGPFWPEGKGFGNMVSLLEVGHRAVVGAGTYADPDAMPLPWSKVPFARAPEHLGWRWSGDVDGIEVRTRLDDAMQLMDLCDRYAPFDRSSQPVVIRIPTVIPPARRAEYLDLALAEERSRLAPRTFVPVALPDGTYLLHFTS